MAAMHDTWAVEYTFNKTTSRDKVKGKHEEFTKALQAYGRLESCSLPFDPVDCSWLDVLQELEKAENAAITSEQGDTRILTKNRRKFSILSKSIMPLLVAIPNDLSILQGGLAVVFHLAQNRERVRRDIIDTFEDIPKIIAMACSKSQSFPEDVNLHNSIDELKTTLFDAIPRLIEVLVPAKLLAKFTSPFRGFQVHDILDRIKRKARGVEVSAGILQDGLAVKHYLATSEIQETATLTQIQVGEISQGISTMDQVVHNMNGRCQEINTNIVDLKGFISNQINDALASRNSMFQMLKDVVSGFNLEQKGPINTKDPARTTALDTASPEKLKEILQVTPGQETHDLDFVLRQSRVFDTLSKSYGAMVMSNPRFQRWLAGNETDLIYVEGHFDPSNFGKTSPVSYFCANMVRLFEESPENITLHFFCGQHVASNDDIKGPRGLLRSLLSQLLQKWPTDSICGLDPAAIEHDQASILIEDLCHIFGLLLRQISIRKTVLCIVDDLAQFERGGWDDEYWNFLRMLGSLVGQVIEVRCKILITSSTRSRRLQEYIPRERCIQVTERDRTMGQRTQR